MFGYNRIILGGTLTTTPDLKPVGQSQVCEFTLEVTETYTKKDNTQGENTCQVGCQCWGKTGEVIAQYLTIGMPILIEGKLIEDKWDYKEKTYSKHRVKVDSFTFVNPKAESEPEQSPEERYDSTDDIPF